MSEREARVEKWPSFFTDAVLHYWLAGTTDEEMREWWATDDALVCAHELAAALLVAVEKELGFPLDFAVCATPPPGDCKRCDLPFSTHSPDGYCYTKGDERFLA